MKKLLSSAAAFTRETSGGITVWGLFNFMLLLGFAGLAIDVNNAVRSRTQLQGAADAAGHAALLTATRTGSTADGQAVGIATAEANMPYTRYGEILATADVEFGSWDYTTRTFSPGVGASAVRVVTRRIDERNNGVSTFLLKVLGYPTLELNTESGWARTGFCDSPDPDNSRPGIGFFALGKVNFQTKNWFDKSFCIHGEEEVKFQTQNIYEPTVQISSSSMDNINYPTSAVNDDTWENMIPMASPHDGLQQYFNSAMPDPTFSSDMGTPSGEAIAIRDANPNDPRVITVSGGGTLTEQMITQAVADYAASLELAGLAMPAGNPMLHVGCSGQSFSIEDGHVISGVDIYTPCKVTFGAGSAFQRGTMVVANNANLAVQGPNGSRLGNDGACVMDTVLLVEGGVLFSSDFEGYGFEIVSGHNVTLAAKAGFDPETSLPEDSPMKGVNVVAAGDINIAGQSWFGYCPGAATNSFDDVIRMVF